MADPKTLVQNFQRDIDTGNPAILDKYIGGSYADHNPPPIASKTPGMAGLKETFTTALGIFSEFKHVVDDQVAQGDRVATRITGSGRHVGPFLGILASNKMVTMSGIAIHRVVNGRLVEHWGQVDGVGLLVQMGAVPAPPAPPPLAAPKLPRSAADRTLSADALAAALRRLFDAGFNQRNRAVVVELVHPSYVNYSMPMLRPGPDGLSDILDGFFGAFPDMHIVVEDTIAETDKAVTRGYFTGTHRGPFMNVPATGKSVRVEYVDLWKAHNGLLVENWVHMDVLGLLIQIGAMPAPAA